MNPNVTSAPAPSNLMQDVGPARPTQPVFSDVVPAQPVFNTAPAQPQPVQPFVDETVSVQSAPTPVPAATPIMDQPATAPAPVMAPSNPMAQPAMQTSPTAPASTPAMPAAAPGDINQPAQDNHSQHAAKPTHPKSEYPLLIIALAVLVTAALAIAAVMAYRQS